MVLHRLQGLAVFRFRLSRHPQHAGLGGAVDIGIQHPHLGAFRRQRQRQVHGGGGFTDSTLAGSDRNDVLDVIDGLEGLLHRMGDDVPAHRHLGGSDAGHRLHLLLEKLFQLGLDSLGRETQFDLYLYPVSVDLDPLDRLGLDQVLFQIGLHITLDRLFDLLTRQLCHRCYSCTPGSPIAATENRLIVIGRAFYRIPAPFPNQNGRSFARRRAEGFWIPALRLNLPMKTQSTPRREGRRGSLGYNLLFPIQIILCVLCASAFFALSFDTDSNAPVAYPPTI